MTEQLVFELAAPEPPSFVNFLPGRNAEAVAALSRFASGEAAETCCFIWGAAGAGKSHLLRAAAAAAGERGRRSSYWPDPGALAATDAESLATHAIVAIDAIDSANADAQARMFTLFNALKAGGGHLLAAAAVPPAQLPLREDLRSRLGWGLVHEILPLADAEKPAALAQYASRRGFRLTDDVVRYLLGHGRRDMATLLSTLAALDRHSLSTKRPITVPMLRDWLQRDMPLTD